MTLKIPSMAVHRMPAPLASSRTYPAPDQAQNPLHPRKHRQDHESENETHHRAPPAERGAEQAGVIGEAERPQPPSEKPEAS